MAMPRLQLQMTSGDRYYDLTAAVGEDGNLQVEVIGVNANGEQIGELEGSLPGADLRLI
ncbi:hypothetical protein [Nonomuraea sp. SYSU D8015]|uniref:hypothetical protein n=1 Tax=Nonomuraea sp. SYSU D8015 TaxID=2593644 RepID=UPI001660991F|nr:hypothetical protein [Nonomuraea sp. SYSU D8015]